MAIVGESSLAGLAGRALLAAAVARRHLEVSLVARRHGRSPVVERLLDAATTAASELGWLDREARR